MSDASSTRLYDPATYGAALFYEDGEYKEWMLNMCTKCLSASASSDPETAVTASTALLRLADLGAGTGDFSALLGGRLGTDKEHITCVEPQAEFYEEIRSRDLSAVQQTASAFCQAAAAAPDADAYKFDMVLLKEAIHLVPAAERLDVFRAIRGMLTGSGGSSGHPESSRLLIVTRPATTELPFFDAARRVYERDTEPTSLYVELLGAAGFRETSVHTHSFSTHVPVDKWLAMLRGRFWSSLFGFSKQELEQGVQEVLASLGGADTVELRDTVNFVTARV